MDVAIAARRATPADIEVVTTIIELAFANDPLWNRALRTLPVAQRRPFWKLFTCLSLLGTHPNHRGSGLGMRLLAHDLALIDEEHCAAYLESSNPANNRRYASAGFGAVGEFSYPDDGPVVTPIWRPAR